MKQAQGQWRRRIKVYCKVCNQWYDEAKVMFINIEEGDRGQDIMTFKCPQCHSEQKSNRVG
jgi:hypothetical protein